jgi:hypothetical protein
MEGCLLQCDNVGCKSKGKRILVRRRNRPAHGQWF